MISSTTAVGASRSTAAAPTFPRNAIWSSRAIGSSGPILPAGASEVSRMNVGRKNALMVLGTASHVGKSILAAGLCRVFSDAGYRVAPFKAQNMSLNSAATPDGGEIGRAQALQAEACHVLPSVEMNPVLLKPSTDTGAQVILLGKVFGQVSASDYHTRRVEQFFPEVLSAYKRLSNYYDLMLLEGAGSPAELNLSENHILK